MTEVLAPIVERRNLIQSVRAIHAVAEAGFTIQVPVDETLRWEHLRQFFGVEYTTARPEAPTLDIGIDHQRPEVAIGECRRMLLFPRSVAERYWSAGPRPIRFTFAGLMTHRRRAGLSRWARGNGFQFGRLRRVSPGIEVTRTKAGRQWPLKGWDTTYVDRLRAAQFTLCPDGDFVWTYRFFEAALAGSLPVVESMCPQYEGFRLFRFDDPAGDLTWREEDAIHNRDLALDRLTMSSPTLRAMILSALA